MNDSIIRLTRTIHAHKGFLEERAAAYTSLAEHPGDMREENLVRASVASAEAQECDLALRTLREINRHDQLRSLRVALAREMNLLCGFDPLKIPETFARRRKLCDLLEWVEAEMNGQSCDEMTYRA